MANSQLGRLPRMEVIMMIVMIGRRDKCCVKSGRIKTSRTNLAHNGFAFAKDIDVCYVEVCVSTIEHNDLQFVGSLKLIDKISQFMEYIRVD